jgi:hypothetical protein
MLTGLYPPGTNKNILTEWQQKNAVPPNEGVDWSKWQKELGDKALPDNFNVFPINMDGHDDDYLLMISKDNCPAYKN